MTREVEWSASVIKGGALILVITNNQQQQLLEGKYLEELHPS